MRGILYLFIIALIDVRDSILIVCAERGQLAVELVDFLRDNNDIIVIIKTFDALF